MYSLSTSSIAQAYPLLIKLSILCKSSSKDFSKLYLLKSIIVLAVKLKQTVTNSISRFSFFSFHFYLIFEVFYFIKQIFKQNFKNCFTSL